MNKIAPSIVLSDTQAIAGFAANDAADGEQVIVITKMFLHSDQKEFYKQIDQLTKIYLGNAMISQISSFLIVRHENGQADIYLNDNIPLVMEIRSKGDITAGQLISKNDIADINSMKFFGIEVLSSDSIIYCFKVGWKFGLFFQFAVKSDPKSHVNIEEFCRELCAYYKYLLFQEIYDVLSNHRVFGEMLNDGWFPFIPLLGSDFEELAKIYNKPKDKRDLRNFVNRFDGERIKKISACWQKHKIFNDKMAIINAGIAGYLRDTEEGFISCIKTLYSEIEGIIRISYVEENGKDPNFNKLQEYIIAKGKSKFVSMASLACSGRFNDYLGNVLLKNFDIKTNDISMSRHTSSHGVARPEDYTKERALQAILALDQIYFYMG